MADISIGVTKTVGLKTSANPLTLPEGALVQTNNVITRRDGILESRRGFKLYGSVFSGGASDRSDQLFEYRNVLLTHYASTMAYDNGTGTWTAFTGTYAKPGVNRINSVTSNGNFYFTTDDGIKKISEQDSGHLSASSIANAGQAKALDMTALTQIVSGDASSFLAEDTGVAYRTVWGKVDNNDNTIVGVPSPSVAAYNYFPDTLNMDLSNLTVVLDDMSTSSAGLLGDGNYVTTIATTSADNPTTIAANVKTLALKIDTDLLYANDAGVTNGLNISSATISTTVISTDAAGNLGSWNTLTINFSGAPTLSNFFTVLQWIKIAGIIPADDLIPINHSYQIFAVNGTTSIDVLIPVRSTRAAFPLTGDTHNTTTTLDNFSTTNGIKIGDLVSGTNIPANTTVSTVGTTSVIVNNASTGTATTAITFTPPTTITTTITAATINSYEYQHIINQTIDTLNGGVVSTPYTSNQLYIVRDAINAIMTRLKVELSGVIPTSSPNSHAMIARVNPTTTATVNLKFPIPSTITDSSYFYQIYRSDPTPTTRQVSGQLGTDVTPNDEMRLIYESNPSSTEISTGYITFSDTVSESFRITNPPLYTNSATGDGILQANDIPPWALDITFFKNNIFYSNTKTRQRYTQLSLVGVKNIANGDKLTISYGPAAADTLDIIMTTGVAQSQTVTYSYTSFDGDMLGKFFLLNGGNNNQLYYVYFGKDGVAEFDPSPYTGVGQELYGRTGIRVDLTNCATAGVTERIAHTLKRYIDDFTTSSGATTFTILENIEGYTTISGSTFNCKNSVGSPVVGFTFTAPSITGAGEDVTNKKALISTASSSAAVHTENTARSIINVINYQSAFKVNAFYTSSEQTRVGNIFLEAKNLNDDIFYLLSSSTGLGTSFNPSLSATSAAATCSVANPTVITWASHGLLNAGYVMISGSTSTPSIDGLHQITYLTANTFSIAVNVTVAGSAFSVKNATLCELSNDERKINRVYYSKYQQPDAVPLLNYFDVGASDRAILRTVALRDSVFVLKEDGCYRISGESAPFNLQLFDASFKLIAPDSVDILNNLIFAWTSLGIGTVSEGGVDVISRDIDPDILKFQSNSFTNFKTTTFAIGYISDSTYNVWTVSETGDTYPTQSYRYNTLNRTWIRSDLSHTSGIILSTDDKMYLGASDTNQIEIERKDFTRLDYSDREYNITIPLNAMSGTTMQLGSINNFAIGDVLGQVAYVTPYIFNSVLLQLDNDTLINDSDYYSTLQTSAGANMRNSLVALATKLDADTGVNLTTYASRIATQTGTIASATAANPTVITKVAHGLVNGRVVAITGDTYAPEINGTFVITRLSADTFSIPVEVPSVLSSGTHGTFITVESDYRDVKACYNDVITNLNLDTGVGFNSYAQVTATTEIEAVVTSVNPITKRITLNQTLDYLNATATLYKAIDCSFTYSPQTFNDYLTVKQVRQSTLMFEHKNFTSATLSFSTDLFPEFMPTPITGEGNGIFGIGTGTFGNGYFGGQGSGAPYRTMIPVTSQRGRFFNLKFGHCTSREKWSILGYTLTGRHCGIRAYR